MTVAIIQDINAALISGKSFCISGDAESSWSVAVPNIFSRIVHFKDSSYHAERNGRIAEVIAHCLKNSPRLSIKDAEKELAVVTGRLFFKQIGNKYDQDVRIAECRKELLAAKLGIVSEVFDKNAGFQSYAEKAHLERYLLTYKHGLQVDKSTLKLKIRHHGFMKDWHDVHEAWQIESQITSSIISSKSSNMPKQPWLYGENGVQAQDMYDWSELKPFRTCDPINWGNQYIFEFCAITADSPRKNGDHSWFRLKTPSGDIYSIGLYRPGKSDWLDNLNFPLRIKKGTLMQPDVSEFWPGKIETISIAITKAEFEEMKQTVENDKKNDGLTFQLFQNNCTLYCKKIAAIAKIDLPTKECVLRIIMPQLIQRIFDKVWSILPALIQKIILVIAAFFVNITQLLLGASIVDSTVTQLKNRPISAHIHSFWVFSGLPKWTSTIPIP